MMRFEGLQEDEVHSGRFLEAHPLLALLLSLRLSGRVPLSTHRSGNVSFNACSGPMVYCFVTTAFQLAMAAYTVRWIILHQEYWVNYDSIVSSINMLVTLIPVLHPVTVTWADTPLIVKFVNQWSSLQVAMQYVVHRPVSSVILDYPLSGGVLVSTLSVLLICLPMNFTVDESNIIVTVSFLLVFGYMNMLSWFWIVSTHFISLAAEQVKNSLLMTMASGVSPRTEMLRGHRALWLELHSFAQALTESMGGSLRALESILVLNFVLSLYSALCYLDNQLPAFTVIILFLIVLHSWIHIFLLHNATHMADNKMERDFLSGILSCRLSKLSNDQLNEIQLLLSAIENSNNRFLIKGMIEFTRPSLVNLLETTLTILVVLVQFKTSTG